MMKKKIERWIKLYLPAPDEESLEEFYRLIRIAASYGYSTVMLEIGGAMEYTTHPEINEGWLDYVRVMNEYPGKTLKVQHQYQWEKNSIHTENGGGQVLSKKILRELVGFCHKSDMEIVPEMPTLSHCDYLLTRHPELAERQEDPFPDTACPNHPDYFPLLGDLFDEVIDLFSPRRINIGHDEFYSMCLCPCCKGKDPARLYSDDINRTAKFLESRGVSTMIWGEKMLNSHFTDGTPCGGAGIRASADHEGVPALYRCAEMISKDVEILHWYWSIDRNLEERYTELGFDYYLANLSPALAPDLGKRLSAEHCKGYCVSNWGLSSFRTLQRNGILYDLIYGALATNGEHDPDDFETLDGLTRKNLYELDRPEGEIFEICHTTQTNIKFRYFFDGYRLDEKHFLMGNHIFENEAGETFTFPVIFGNNISNSSVRFGRFVDPALRMDRFSLDQQYVEVTGGSFPETAPDGKTLYYCRFPHPCPGQKLHYLRFEPASAFIPDIKLLPESEILDYRENTKNGK